VLDLLESGERYGLELVDASAGRLKRGSVYVTLGRMETKGFVASRQEGGPKSVLESMATGVPLVTTRAGQAPDLVTDGANGLLVDVEDAEALAEGLRRLHDDAALAARLREAGRRTAEETSHRALAPRWEALLEGFAERADG